MIWIKNLFAAITWRLWGERRAYRRMKELAMARGRAYTLQALPRPNEIISERDLYTTKNERDMSPWILANPKPDFK